MVAAAVLWDGRLLAARRAAPPETAGRWELPGGKVEPGEDPGDALVREIAEELGCQVVVGEWLDGDVPIDERHALRAAVCELVGGEPDPREHDRIRWLSADELADVDWLEPDRPFLDRLREMMAP